MGITIPWDSPGAALPVALGLRQRRGSEAGAEAAPSALFAFNCGKEAGTSGFGARRVPRSRAGLGRGCALRPLRISSTSGFCAGTPRMMPRAELSPVRTGSATTVKKPTCAISLELGNLEKVS